MMMSKASSGVVWNILSNVKPAGSRELDKSMEGGESYSKLTVVDYMVNFTVFSVWVQGWMRSAEEQWKGR